MQSYSVFHSKRIFPLLRNAATHRDEDASEHHFVYFSVSPQSELHLWSHPQNVCSASFTLTLKPVQNAFYVKSAAALLEMVYCTAHVQHSSGHGIIWFYVCNILNICPTLQKESLVIRWVTICIELPCFVLQCISNTRFCTRSNIFTLNYLVFPFGIAWYWVLLHSKSSAFLLSTPSRGRLVQKKCNDGWQRVGLIIAWSPYWSACLNVFV